MINSVAHLPAKRKMEFGVSRENKPAGTVLCPLLSIHVHVRAYGTNRNLSAQDNCDIV